MELTAKEIQVSIAEKTILQNISLKVDDGSFCALIGPNGSGKSTFLKSVYQMMRIEQGVILLNEQDIKQYSKKQLARKMAVVGQFHQINFEYSVMDIVLMGRTPHLRLLEREKESDFQLARDSLRKVGMEKYEDRNFQSLSGGEKQRVILARALTQCPKFLILDEPTNHLDIRYQLEILSIIKELNVSVLTALHDLNIAAQYCDYIYMIKDGKIIISGRPEKIITTENIKSVYDVEANVFHSPIDNQIMVQYHGITR
jgi:iron complex transport system ATP-binding protein